MSAIQHVITEHLDIWTAADTGQKSGRGRSGANAAKVYGISKLRELILELAVRGKLVPQDASDEPASELLKRIHAEKGKLIADGRIRKDKQLAPIAEEEMPFSLPHGWEWVRIGYVGHDWGQKTPDSVFTYIEVSAIDSQRGTISSPELVQPENAPSRARKVVKKGSVIYSTIRPYLLNIAVIEQDISPEPIASTAFAVVHPFCAMPPRYFLHFFRSPVFVRYVESVQTGIAYPAINDGQFFSGIVPIPPIEEQRRIVAKVDELMALCDQLETEHNNATEAHEKLVSHLLGTLTQSQSAEDFSANWQQIATHFDTLFTTEASIDALKQALLQLAVMGKLVPQDPNDEPASELLKRTKNVIKTIPADQYPFSLPQSWGWIRFGDALDFQGGGQPPKHAFSDVKLDGYVQLIQIRDLGDKPKPVFIKRELAAKFCTQEDIMIGRYGASVGKVFWGKDGAYNVALVKIINECGLYYNRFLYEFFKSPYGQSLFSGISRSAQAGFNKGDIEGQLMPVCSLAEQYRIVAKLDELIALCDHLKSLISAAGLLQHRMADEVARKSEL